MVLEVTTEEVPMPVRTEECDSTTGTIVVRVDV